MDLKLVVCFIPSNHSEEGGGRGVISTVFSFLFRNLFFLLLLTLPFALSLGSVSARSSQVVSLQ